VFRFDVEDRKLSVSKGIRRGGGVMDGQLLSYMTCPSCRFVVRFMARFETPEDANDVTARMTELRMEQEKEAVGRTVIGGVIAKGTHNYGSGQSVYGYSHEPCDLAPHVGTERDLAAMLWKKYFLNERHEKAAPPLPSGRVRLRGVDGFAIVVDQIDARAKPLVFWSRSKWAQLTERFVPYRSMPWDQLQKQRERIPDMFIDLVFEKRDTVAPRLTQ
jgi:hypothetical protein